MESASFKDVSIHVTFVSEKEQKRFSRNFPVTFAEKKRVELFTDTPCIVLGCLLNEYKPTKVVFDVRHREYVERSEASR